jgi:hypothetical protein
MQFTYDAYRSLLEAIANKFEIRALCDAYEPTGKRPVLLLRHDVDISIEKAIVMACIEHDMGLASSYMLMADAPLYGPHVQGDVAARLSWLSVFRREVGVHVELEGEDHEVPLTEAVAKLEPLLAKDLAIKSVSFHAPQPKLINAYMWKKHIQGLVNAYANVLMGLYITDSGGRWCAGTIMQFMAGKFRRDVDPLAELKRTRERKVQLLVHPVWWGDTDMEPVLRLEAVRRWLVREGVPDEDVEAGFMRMMPRLWRSR